LWVDELREFGGTWLQPGATTLKVLTWIFHGGGGLFPLIMIDCF